jgi:hypothetical protein
MLPMTTRAMALAALVACGGSERRAIRIERIAPAAAPGCGAPDDARTLLVTALGEFPASETTVRSVVVEDGEFSLEGFPAETSALEVEVLGFGGAVRAVGRSGAFDIDALEDGDAVRVFMAPLRGFCPTGPPGAARDRPLLARTAGGILVAGGADSAGSPVDPVELYDPATGQFSGLGSPLYGSDLEQGLTGATMTSMPDDRVVVAGGAGSAFQIYHPAAGFETARFLRQARAFHAAVALDADRLLLAGGCARLEADACAPGSALATSVILSLASGELEDGPPLAVLRIGGTAIAEADGRVLLVGGTDEGGALVTDAERIDPATTGAGEVIAGTGGSAAPLASGATFAAFAPHGVIPSDAGAVIPPGGGTARPVDVGAARSGVTLTELESGLVLVTGGEEPPVVFAPARGEVDPLSGAPPERHTALRLDDGSVLMVGGHDGDQALAEAWIYRPELLGPLTGAVSVTFATDASSAPLVPRDPARARVVEAHYEIESSGGGDVPGEWAVVAGPRFAEVRLEASISALGGGAAALLWFRGPADHAVIALEPGSAARLVQVAGGEATPLGSCSGEVVGDLSPPERHELTVESRGGELAVTLDGGTVLTCQVDPPASGLVGLAPLGDGALLRIDLVSASR